MRYGELVTEIVCTAPHRDRGRPCVLPRWLYRPSRDDKGRTHPCGTRTAQLQQEAEMNGLYELNKVRTRPLGHDA